MGVVEGLTEYLPVSSTGHLILTGHALGLTSLGNEQGFLGKKINKNAGRAADAFEIVIQLGAILAVLGLYRKRVGQMLGGISGGANALLSRQPLTGLDDGRRSGLHLAGLLMLAFLPAAIVGKLFHQRIEDNLFGPVPVAWALAVGGILMIVVEYVYWRRPSNVQRTTDVNRMFYWQALVIGMAQVLAMWPGTSRSMITMLAALVVGLDMVAAAEFSFLLALPTLGAATLYSGYRNWGDLIHSAGAGGLIVGLLVSAVVAAIAVKGFVKWLTHHGLMPFGVYRILLAVALLIYFARA